MNQKVNDVEYKKKQKIRSTNIRIYAISSFDPVVSNK